MLYTVIIRPAELYKIVVPPVNEQVIIGVVYRLGEPFQPESMTIFEGIQRVRDG